MKSLKTKEQLLRDFQRHSVASSASALAPLTTRQASESHTRLLEADTGNKVSETNTLSPPTLYRVTPDNIPQKPRIECETVIPENPRNIQFMTPLPTTNAEQEKRVGGVEGREGERVIRIKKGKDRGGKGEKLTR